MKAGRKILFAAIVGTAILAFASCALLDRASSLASEACNDIRPSPASLEGWTSFGYDESGPRPLLIHVLRPGPASEPAPAVLFFFGGGWRVGEVTQFADQARAFQQAGYIAALADYRVFCRDGVSPSASTEDAIQAYAWLLEHAAELGIDSSRVVLAGASAGGQLALNAGLANGDTAAAPRAFVLFNPAIDLTGFAIRWATGLPQDEARRISPAFFDLAALPPTVIFHGQNDRLVRIGSVRAFCAHAVQVGRICELHEYAGQGHGFFNSREEYATLGTSPFAATLAGALEFLQNLGISRQENP